jgi:hypothetical protein
VNPACAVQHCCTHCRPLLHAPRYALRQAASCAALLMHSLTHCAGCSNCCAALHDVLLPALQGTASGTPSHTAPSCFMRATSRTALHCRRHWPSSTSSAACPSSCPQISLQLEDLHDTRHNTTEFQTGRCEMEEPASSCHTNVRPYRQRHVNFSLNLPQHRSNSLPLYTCQDLRTACSPTGRNN